MLDSTNSNERDSALFCKVISQTMSSSCISCILCISSKTELSGSIVTLCVISYKQNQCNNVYQMLCCTSRLATDVGTDQKATGLQQGQGGSLWTLANNLGTPSSRATNLLTPPLCRQWKFWLKKTHLILRCD